MGTPGDTDTKQANGKQDAIVADLRGQITSGKLSPLDRLPSNKRLQQIYSVTSVTISRVVRRLVADGYLVARERSGVFVAERLPHLARFGLVFHSHPSRTVDWTRMFDVIYREAVRGVPGLDAELVTYHDIFAGRYGADYDRLVADVAAKRVGGLIFTSDPWHLWDTPLLHGHGLPLVAIMGRREQADLFAMDFGPFSDKAMEYLASRGRKRIAQVVVSERHAVAGFETQFESGALQYGLETRPQWLQYADVAQPGTVTNIVRLLLSGPKPDRPDALLVADDNFIEHAELGILQAGVKVPDELELVAHCNFPYTAGGRLPMHRIGHDMRDLLMRAVDVLRTVQEGGEPARVVGVPAVLESEFETRWA